MLHFIQTLGECDTSCWKIHVNICTTVAKNIHNVDFKSHPKFCHFQLQRFHATMSSQFFVYKANNVTYLITLAWILKFTIKLKFSVHKCTSARFISFPMNSQRYQGKNKDELKSTETTARGYASYFIMFVIYRLITLTIMIMHIIFTITT